VGPGVYNVTLDVVDEQLNTNTCQVTVTVLDNTPPTVTPPPNLVVPNMLWVPPASLLGVSVTDNCGVAQTNYLGQTAAGDSPRLITRAFEGVDIHGNRATNTQTITVLSTRPDPMAYEPFAGYNNGSLIGQTYAGSGFEAGAWTAPSGDVNVSAAGGLTYVSGPLTLLTTGGKATTPAAGPINTALGNLDVSAGGPFGGQGLVDGGFVGGGNVNGTLYYSFLARNNSADVPNGENDFAAMQLYRNGAEVFGVGNYWDAWAYSTFGLGGDGNLLRPSDDTWKDMDNQVHLFVVKIQFVANGDDTVTVWMDPDLTLDEGSQPNTVYRRTVTGDASFNQVAVRSGSLNNDNSWDFDEIRFAGTWGDVTPTAPAITVQPVASQMIPAGSNATMSVTAVGSPSLGYVWVRNLNILSNQTAPTLTISNAQTNDSGAYVVFVYNAFGAVTSAVSTLIVQEPPPPEGLYKLSLRVLETGADLVFQGLPGRTYDLLRSTNFTEPYVWWKIGEATATNDGKFGYLDAEKPPRALYRTREQ